MAANVLLSTDAANDMLTSHAAKFNQGSGAGKVHGYSVLTACTATNATNLFTDAGHGLVDTDRVKIQGTTVPTGINADTIYYVVTGTTDTFQVSLTSGGAAVTFSDDGTSVTYKLRLCEITLNDPAWGTPSANSVTLDNTPEPEDSTPEHAGTLENYDGSDSDDVTVHTGKCKTSGGAMNWNSLTVSTSVAAKITSGTMTHGLGAAT